MTELFSLSSIPKLLQLLSSVRSDRKKELANIGNTFGPTSDLYVHYVEPDAQLLNPADESDAPHAIRDFKKPAFKVIEDFLQPTKHQTDGRNQMMILGDAGMGKTSLLVMLKIQHIMGFIPRQYGCALYKLNAKSLDLISNHPYASSTVLLLDALDEDPEGFGRVEEYLLEILNRTKNFYKVIITCRTQFFPRGDRSPFDSIGQIRLGGFHCPAVFLSYFDQRQVDEYLYKRFRDDRLIAQGRKIIHSSDSLQFRPMLLSFIDDLIDSPLPLKTRSDIYYALINKWLLREQVKLFEQGRKIESDLLLAVCVDLANFMRVNRSNEINTCDLKLFLASDEKMSILTAIDIGGRSLLNRNSDGSFRFSHLSIQEYLFARGIAKGKVRSAPHSIFVSDLELEFLTANPISGVDLRFIAFKANFISEGHFQECNLSGMSFVSDSFANTQFIECDFSRATFDTCDFQNVIFYKCCFDGARFPRCTGSAEFRENQSGPKKSSAGRWYLDQQCSDI